jgi:hypothetical protein
MGIYSWLFLGGISLKLGKQKGFRNADEMLIYHIHVVPVNMMRFKCLTFFNFLSD